MEGGGGVEAKTNFTCNPTQRLQHAASGSFSEHSGAPSPPAEALGGWCAHNCPWLSGRPQGRLPQGTGSAIVPIGVASGEAACPLTSVEAKSHPSQPGERGTLTSTPLGS